MCPLPNFSEVKSHKDDEPILLDIYTISRNDERMAWIANVHVWPVHKKFGGRNILTVEFKTQEEADYFSENMPTRVEVSDSRGYIMKVLEMGSCALNKKSDLILIFDVTYWTEANLVS